MATILEDILRPTQELDGVRYFDAESVILLGAAVSDFGRDYNVTVPLEDKQTYGSLKLGAAVSAIYSGEWIPGPKLEARLMRLRKELPLVPLATLTGFGRFSYRDPRSGEAERLFEPQGEFTDLPEPILGRFAGAHFTTLQKTILRFLVKDGFVGTVGEKLNGHELTYWNRRRVEPSGQSYYAQGFYLYYFLDDENHLFAWKTGIDMSFQRDGRYGLIGGRVKAHDSYPGQPPKTLLSRAKFFDYQLGDSYG